MRFHLIRIYEGRCWIYSDQNGHHWTLQFALSPAHALLAQHHPNWGRGIE